MDTNEDHREQRRIAVWISLGCGLFLLVKLVVPSYFSGAKLDDPVTIGVLIVAALPWLSQLFISMKMPGGWELVFRQLEKRQEDLEQKRAETDRKIQSVLEALTKLISAEAMKFLKDLDAGKPIIFTDCASNKQEWRNTLRRLRLLGLINPTESISRIVDEKTEGHDIAPKLNITDSGRDYLNSLAAEDLDDK
jgi:hypothetical protein